uniref:Uncharacterized protein n=1 Tax=Anguilla anguilla TaxID=7936 RepID=A0A0E9SN94_ANGAN
MPISAKVEKSSLWLTMSNADRSRRIRDRGRGVRLLHWRVPLSQLGGQSLLSARIGSQICEGLAGCSDGTYNLHIMSSDVLIC